jgi:hypothetical protein
MGAEVSEEGAYRRSSDSGDPLAFRYLAARCGAVHFL